MTIGYLKGESATRIHRELENERDVVRPEFLGTGVLL